MSAGIRNVTPFAHAGRRRRPGSVGEGEGPHRGPGSGRPERLAVLAATWEPASLDDLRAVHGEYASRPVRRRSPGVRRHRVPPPGGTPTGATPPG